MWPIKKLKEICDIQSGLWKGKNEPFTTALVLRNTNFTAAGKFDYSNVVELDVETKQLAKREVVKNDIILEKSGGGDKTPVGRVCIHDSESELPVSFSNFTARIRVLDQTELDAQFLHKFLYFLYISGKTEPMQRHSTGIRNLQLSQYKEIDVPLPPLAEQQRIVAKLDAAFAEIDRANASSEEKLDSIDQLKIRALAKLLFQTKSASSLTLLESCVETFHQGLNTAGEKVKFSDSGYPVLQTRNVNEGRIDFVEKIKFVDEQLWEKYKGKYKPQVGDIFFTNIGTIGKTAVVTEDRDYLIHWNIFKIRTKPTILLPEFLKLNLDFLTDSGYFSSKQKGGTVSFVTKKMIGGAPIHLCSVEEQRKFLKIAEKIENACDVAKSRTQAKKAELAMLKASMLAQALKVSESEAA